MCAQRLIIKLNSFGEPILSHLDYLLYISGWNNYPITLIGAPSNLCASCLVHSCCNRCYGNSCRHTLWKTTTRQAAWSLQGCHIRPQHSGLPLVWINNQTPLFLDAFLDIGILSTLPPFIAAFCLWPLLHRLYRFYFLGFHFSTSEDSRFTSPLFWGLSLLINDGKCGKKYLSFLSAFSDVILIHPSRRCLFLDQSYIA